MKTCSVGQYGNCIELQSGKFRIAVTQDFGPRVLGGWINGSDNIFHVMPPTPMTTVDTGFTLYGGHRLWHSPEVAPRTYAPDNAPVKVTNTDEGLVFENEPELLTGLQKKITISQGDDDFFILNHEITNCGQWNVTMAPWALSIMAPGGTAVIPQGRDTERDPYTPDRSLVLWPYTSTADKRLTLEDDYILLRQIPGMDAPAKIGFYADDGWIAYVNNGVALVKIIEYYDPKEVEYPDNGCNLESYSCGNFCEIETLAPLFCLEPGETCCHQEIWQAIYDLPQINCAADVAKHLAPRILA